MEAGAWSPPLQLPLQSFLCLCLVRAGAMWASRELALLWRCPCVSVLRPLCRPGSRFLGGSLAERPGSGRVLLPLGSWVPARTWARSAKTLRGIRPGWGCLPAASCWLCSGALCAFCKKTCSQEVSLSSWQPREVGGAGVKLFREGLRLDPALRAVRPPSCGASAGSLRQLIMGHGEGRKPCSHSTSGGFRGCAAWAAGDAGEPPREGIRTVG